jgi:hypothetical protein
MKRRVLMAITAVITAVAIIIAASLTHYFTAHRGTSPQVAVLVPQLKAFSLTLGNCTSYLLNATFIRLHPWGLFFLEEPSTAIAGPVELHMWAYMTATAPVEILVFRNFFGQFIFQTQPSTSISGEYNISLGPGLYYVMIYNPSNSTYANIYGWLTVEMCKPESWILGVLNGTLESEKAGYVVTMGVVAYGVINASGTYYAYTLKTNAAMGKAYISPNVVVNSYGYKSVLKNAFSIELNAYVEVKLANGQTQYYFVQNIVSRINDTLQVGDFVFNVTTYTLNLSPSAIKGNGKEYRFIFPWSRFYAYNMAGSVPFGWVTLETSVSVENGSAVIRLYADGQNYDTVTITPSAPATSAYIVISSNTTFSAGPLVLELVFAGARWGYNAVLRNGSIPLQLYVNADGVWVPPPSAWSIAPLIRFAVGYINRFYSGNAIISSTSAGSAVMSPGTRNFAMLWSDTIVAGPTGIVATTDTNLTSYLSHLPQTLYFNNGTRLLLEAVYINGQPAPYSALNNVPVGSIVVGRYVKQYYVVIRAPGNITEGWYNADSTLYVQPIYLGNSTRLAPKPAEVVISAPLNVTVEYTTKQYLVVVSSVFGVKEYWVDAGSRFTIPLENETLNGVEFIPYEVVANGARTNGTIVIDKPTNVTVTYMAEALVTLSPPQPYAEAVLKCGSEEASAQGFFVSSLEPVLYNPTTAECSVSTTVFSWPYVMIIVVVAAAIAVATRLIKKRGR